MEAFRTRKETIKATYTAAEAQTRIGEAVSGISEEMGDVGMAIQRAEDKTAQMQARAGAIDELMASGRAGRRHRQPRDDIQAELDRMGAGHDVDRELERMKGELAGARRPGRSRAPRRATAGNRASDGQAGQAADQPQAGEGHDRPDPGRGPARRGRHRRRRAERSWTPSSRRRSNAGDEDGFRRADALLARVRAAGTPLPADRLEPSDLILPYADASMDDVREPADGRGPDPGLRSEAAARLSAADSAALRIRPDDS